MVNIFDNFKIDFLKEKPSVNFFDSDYYKINNLRMEIAAYRYEKLKEFSDGTKIIKIDNYLICMDDTIVNSILTYNENKTEFYDIKLISFFRYDGFINYCFSEFFNRKRIFFDVFNDKNVLRFFWNISNKMSQCKVYSKRKDEDIKLDFFEIMNYKHDDTFIMFSAGVNNAAV